MTDNTLKKYLAEFLGTAVLVFMGCGSAVFLGNSTMEAHLVVALSFGISIVAMAFMIGNISGCHINPVVSLAAFMDKRINCSDFLTYITSQLSGGVAGAALLYIVSDITGIDHTGGLASNIISGAGSVGAAFFVEVILTFIFLLTILGVTAFSYKGLTAGIVIGLTFTFVHILGLPLTGTSVNPARSLGPALFAGGQALRDLWIFIFAPATGAVLAVLVFRFIKTKA